MWGCEKPWPGRLAAEPAGKASKMSQEVSQDMAMYH